MSYKGGHLADGTPLNVAVYRAYRNAGLSHSQALAITAEVGRENGFNPSVLFGSHTDPAGARGGGKIRNVGMLSWNQGRDTQVLNHLKQAGVISNGVMHRTQENLNAQAKFSVQEMKGAYRHKLQHFWANPNDNPESFARELGKNYIVWAYGQDTIRGKTGGRVPFNWRAHDGRRRGYLNVLGSMVGGSQSFPSVPTHSANTGQDLFFIGDSIAHGYRGKGQGITKMGMNPSWVLGQVNHLLKKNPNALAGKTVVLSSGLSNNHQDLASVEQQLKTLKGAGANVMLLGVANQFSVNGGNGRSMNAGLADLAGRYGVAFNGGFNAGRDNVHPASYSLKAINLGGMKRNLPTQHSSYQPEFITGDKLQGMLDFALGGRQPTVPQNTLKSTEPSWITGDKLQGMLDFALGEKTPNHQMLQQRPPNLQTSQSSFISGENLQKMLNSALPFG